MSGVTPQCSGDDRALACKSPFVQIDRVFIETPGVKQKPSPKHSQVQTISDTCTQAGGPIVLSMRTCW
ncbi:hypothetical protein STEG23_012068, partial [Scotinomys teguina]